MSHCYLIEDERHAHWHGVYASWAEVIDELQRLAQIPWDQNPNRAPCSGWQACGRNYEIVMYADHSMDEELERWPALTISAEGVQWDKEFDKRGSR